MVVVRIFHSFGLECPFCESNHVLERNFPALQRHLIKHCMDEQSVTNGFRRPTPKKNSQSEILKRQRFAKKDMSDAEKFRKVQLIQELLTELSVATLEFTDHQRQYNIMLENGVKIEKKVNTICDDIGKNEVFLTKLQKLDYLRCMQVMQMSMLFEGEALKREKFRHHAFCATYLKGLTKKRRYQRSSDRQSVVSDTVNTQLPLPHNPLYSPSFECYEQPFSGSELPDSTESNENLNPRNNTLVFANNADMFIPPVSLSDATTIVPPELVSEVKEHLPKAPSPNADLDGSCACPTTSSSSCLSADNGPMQSSFPLANTAPSWTTNTNQLPFTYPFPNIGGTTPDQALQLQQYYQQLVLTNLSNWDGASSDHTSVFQNNSETPGGNEDNEMMIVVDDIPESTLKPSSFSQDSIPPPDPTSSFPSIFLQDEASTSPDDVLVNNPLDNQTMVEEDGSSLKDRSRSTSKSQKHERHEHHSRYLTCGKVADFRAEVDDRAQGISLRKRLERMKGLDSPGSSSSEDEPICQKTRERRTRKRTCSTSSTFSELSLKMWCRRGHDSKPFSPSVSPERAVDGEVIASSLITESDEDQFMEAIHRTYWDLYSHRERLNFKRERMERKKLREAQREADAEKAVETKSLLEESTSPVAPAVSEGNLVNALSSPQTVEVVAEQFPSYDLLPRRPNAKKNIIIEEQESDHEEALTTNVANTAAKKTIAIHLSQHSIQKIETEKKCAKSVYSDNKQTDGTATQNFCNSSVSASAPVRVPKGPKTPPGSPVPSPTPPFTNRAHRSSSDVIHVVNSAVRSSVYSSLLRTPPPPPPPPPGEDSTQGTNVDKMYGPSICPSTSSCSDNQAFSISAQQHMAAWQAYYDQMNRSYMDEMNYYRDPAYAVQYPDYMSDDSLRRSFRPPPLMSFFNRRIPRSLFHRNSSFVPSGRRNRDYRRKNRSGGRPSASYS